MAYYVRVWSAGYMFEGHCLTDAGDRYVSENTLLVHRLAGPLPAEYLPTEIHIDAGATAKLKDVINLAVGHLVGEKFRLAVEGLEPGVHQFHKITLIRKKGEIHQPYYFFLPGQAVDAIFPTGLPHGAHYVGLEEDSDKTPKISMGGGVGHCLVLSRPAIAGRHLWTPVEVGYGLFISDELHARLEDRKVNNLRYEACKEVDEIWDRETIIGPIDRKIKILKKRLGISG